VAKKKKRTPPPPRPVQAPRARTAAGDRRRLTVVYLVAGAGFLMLAIVLLAILAFGGGVGGSSASEADVAKAMSAAGCTFHSYPGLSQKHVRSLTAKVKYNSFPPSSGPHYFQPAPFGVYDEPLSQVQVVHNLEHGGVAIQYGNRVPKATVDQLLSFYRDDPNGLIMDPLPKLGNQIALTAWTVVNPDSEQLFAKGRVAKCTRFDQKAFETFLKAFRYRGPESCLKKGQVGCYASKDLEPGE
jgi:Protein of unknown function (DUF3105)